MTNIELCNKIENSLYSRRILKKDVADKLGISRQAFSRQLKNLKEGKGINTKTLFILEELTGIFFFKE
jgi:DNA-binding transcriptional regulator LsrR (DeoR family)